MASAFSGLSCGGAAGDPATAAVDTTATPPTSWQTANVSVTFSGTGDTAHMEYMIDCGTPQTIANGGSVLVGDGIHTVSHRAVDSTSAATSWIDETVQVDTVNPVDTTSDRSGWHNAAVSVTANGTDATSGVSRIDYSVDGTPASAAPGGTFSVSGDGDHTVVSEAFDTAGNHSGTRTDTVRIDTVNPTDTTSYPVGWQYTATTVNLTGTDNVGGSTVDRVEWKLDGGGVNTGGNPSPISIPEGTHVLATQIVDTAGNASGFVNHTIMVDLTGPQDTTTVPAGWVTTPQTIAVKGTDPQGAGIQQVEWDVDGGQTFSGPNNSTVAINSDGDHILRTHVTDGSGTWSSWLTQHVKIDTLVPTDLTSAPSGWQTGPLNVDITGNDGSVGSGIATVEWILDGVDTTSTSNPKTITISADGVHTLSTRVIDNAGLVSGWTNRTIRVDKTAPANLTPLPPLTWMATPYNVYLNGSDGGSGFKEMRYSIDGAPDQGAPAGTPVTIGGTGTHHLVSWVVDVAGNASGQRDDVINIDTLPPTDTTTAPVGSQPNHTTVAVTGTDAHSGVDHVAWKLDDDTDAEAHTGPSGSLAQIDGPGLHTLYTKVYDAAGNSTGWKSSTVTIDVSGDVTPPTDTSTTAQTGWYTDAGVPFTVSATDAGSDVWYVQWRMDGGAIQRYDGRSTAITVTGEGTHDIETRARDLNGNVSLWRSQTINIDTVPPADASNLPTGWTNTNIFTLKGTDATSGPASEEYYLDAGAKVTIPDNTAMPGPALSDGLHTIKHRAVDAAGQASDWVVDHVKIDTALPTNTSPAAPTGWQQSISLALTGTDAASGFDHGEWTVDGGATVQPGPVALTTDGTHTLETRAVDAAGNFSAWRSETVKVDATAPANTTARPSAEWLKTTWTAAVTGTDAGSGPAHFEWTLDGVAQTGTTVSVTAPGMHEVRTRVGDNAGNWSDWRVDKVGVDRAAPALTVNCGSDVWHNAPVGCGVSGDGGESGLSALTVSANGGSPTDVMAGTGYVVSSDGDWTLAVAGADKAGNTASASAHVRIDQTPPTAGLSCAADTGSKYLCHAVGADALSGLASLTYSVNGGPATAPAADGSFTVPLGRVVVHATDNAGNGGNSVALILSDRVIPNKPTPRTVSEAVLRSGHGSAIARALGEIALTSTADLTSVDLRPLAVGKGSFKVTMKIRADKKRKTYRKTVKASKGYTRRISVHMPSAAEITVDLTIRRKSGKRWVAYASGGAELG